MLTRALGARDTSPATRGGRVWLGPRVRALGVAVGRLAALFALVVASLLIVVAGAGSLTNQWRLVPVRSDSMGPSLRSGDAAIATPVSVHDVRRGDVIVYHAPTPDHPLVVHRVYAVLQSGSRPVIQTKADASKALDPWRARLQGSQVWRVGGAVPFVGSVVTLFGATWLRTALLLLGAVLVALSLRQWSRSRGDGSGEGQTEGEEPTRRRRRRPHAAAAALIPVLVMLLASSAHANFGTVTADTALSGGNGSYTADALSAPTGLSCTWTASTSVRLDWTATSSTWADGHEVQRKVGSGAFADYAATTPRTTVTYTDASATAPTSNAYSYQVQGTKNSWRSPATSSLAATACAGGISTIAYPTTASATVQTVYDVAIDSSGNTYLADNAGCRIRKVDTSGIISTVAGTGTCTSTGNGGAATAATFNNPQGVAVDSSGAVFVADTGGNQIRKFTVGGTIAAFAGTGTSGNAGDGAAATSATLAAPTGVAVDSSGNVYIADKSNNRIRKVSSGTITAFAGTGTAGGTGDGGAATSALLNLPQKVAVDSAGTNVYIADTGSNRVRKVNGGTITAFAGTGTAGNTGDTGTATLANMNSPTGLAVDSAGVVYIADRDNKNVRQVSAGTITHVAGTSSLGYTGYGYPAATSSMRFPNGLAVDSAGGIIIADYGIDNRVRKITTDTPKLLITFAGNGTATSTGDGGPAATAEMVNPYHLAVDSSGNVYIADAGAAPDGNRIRKYLVATGTVATIAGTGASGSAGDGGAALSATLSGPKGIAVDASGNVFVGDTVNNRIREIQASTSNIVLVAGGSVTTAGFAGDGGSATAAAVRMSSPLGVTVDASNNIYFADKTNERIRKFTVGGTISTVVGNGTGGFNGDGTPATSFEVFNPDGLGVDSAGNVFIADRDNNRIRKYTVGTNTLSTLVGTGTCSSTGDGGAATSATICTPEDVVVDGSNYYLTDTNANKIRKVTGTTISLVVGTGTSGFTGDGGRALDATLSLPQGLAEIAGSHLYLTDNAGHVRKIAGPV